MEFRNLTPFEALAFSAYNVHDEEHHVVAIKVLYRLVPDASGASTHRAELLLGDPRGKLRTSDEYYGAMNASSVRDENDLSPFKPRCDVIVRATAHAPNFEPAARWQARLRVTAPDAPHPSDEPEAPRGVLIDKTLDVCGERWFVRAAGAWELTDPAPALTVPMRWENAFGGRCVVEDPESTEERKLPLLINEVCFTNPVGRGWVEPRYFEALERAKQPPPERLPAPQVEPFGAPVNRLVESSHPAHAIDASKMADMARDYGFRPAGFGFVGRAWTPRLQRAGTYDAEWLDRRHPFLPEDFSFAYWNAAPDDQQIAHPGLGLRVELWNLAAEEHAPHGYVSFELPPHRAFAMAWMQGLPVPVPASIDTLTVDAEAMTVTCVWRTLFSRALGVTDIEARFEMDPNAPLLKLEVGARRG